MDLEFTLVQKAKSKGGDKYVCTSNPDFTIYFPQNISRKNDIPQSKLVIKVSEAS